MFPRARIAAALALTACLAAPGSAGAGYDIAHAVERTCEPGAPLVFSEQYAGKGKTITVPGAVVGCPLGPLEGRLQISIGPERIGEETYRCVYYSHLNGAGRDLCSSAGSDSAIGALQAAERHDGRIAITGMTDDTVSRIDLAPRALFRATRAAGAVHYTSPAAGGPRFFSLVTTPWELCTQSRPRLIARDSSGRIIHTQRIDHGVPLMDGPGSVSALARLCEINTPRADSGLDALTIAGTALLLS
jgi:hypothetical protein